MPTDVLKIMSLVALPAASVRALEVSSFGPFEVRCFDDPLQPQARLAEADCDALLLHADAAAGGKVRAVGSVRGAAVLVVTDDLSAASVLASLHLGAHEVFSAAELAHESLPRRIRVAIERQRRERAARTAYATDLATGLPHQQQLIEHMSHLLALREREPAPMAVLALRIEGLSATEARLGREAANVLRRRLAVRLRAGVRASDVVAAIGVDTFAVLLGALLTADDAHRVGAKLLAALLKPSQVMGEPAAVAAALGIAQYPQDGTQPEPLLQRALGLAASAQAQGRAGRANFVEGGAAPRAANDDATS